MPDFKHVGSVEILRSRIYNIDPYNKDILATGAVVEEGTLCPLMSDGYSHVWLMAGVINGQFLRRGDGMFVAAKHANAMPLNISVTFPSKFYGPDDWEDLLTDPICIEGDHEQRLRNGVLEES